MRTALWFAMEQYEYLVPMQVTDENKQKEILDTMRAKVALVKSKKLTKDSPRKELPLRIPAEYWLSIKDYDPAQVAVTVKRPMLILQGERDYQVTMSDFAVWKKALADRRDVTLKSYANLNHLFHTGKGKAKPLEYALPGAVSETAINDIAEWVQKTSKK